MPFQALEWTPMLETYASAEHLAVAAAQGVAGQLSGALERRGRASLAATGGRAPGPVYDLLSRADLDWSRVSVTLSDERCVAAEDPRANARLVIERLLTGKAAQAHFLPLWPRPDPAALRALLPFDAVMLGMGEDGHIASLIPGSPNLAQGLDPAGAALMLDTPAGLGSPPLARVTLTLSALLQARAIFLLIAGAAKRAAIAAALGGADLPVRGLLDQARAPVRILWTAQSPAPAQDKV